MKFAADECCDAVLVAGLRDDGHDVWYAIESARGADDETILRQAAADDRILLTEDKDFGELVVRLGLPAIGVVLLRMNPADSDTKLIRMREVLEHHAARLTGSLSSWMNRRHDFALCIERRNDARLRSKLDGTQDDWVRSRRAGTNESRAASAVRAGCGLVLAQSRLITWPSASGRSSSEATRSPERPSVDILTVCPRKAEGMTPAADCVRQPSSG